MLSDRSALAGSHSEVWFLIQSWDFMLRKLRHRGRILRSDGFLQAGVMISLPLLLFDPPSRSLLHLAQCWVPSRHSVN